MSDSHETILCAAITYRGEIFQGRIHCDAHDALKEKYPTAFYSECVQGEGFLTTRGRFLDREAAKRFAHDLDLLRNTRNAWVDPKLFTEDLRNPLG